MREYPDPQSHFHRHMDQAAQNYADGLRRAGLQPNERLTRAVFERARRQARENYAREAADTLENNLNVIMRDHHQYLNQIKQEGARLPLWTCPPIALLSGAMAWYQLSQPDHFITGLAFAINALVFLAILVLGAIFDRPRRTEP